MYVSYAPLGPKEILHFHDMVMLEDLKKIYLRDEIIDGGLRQGWTIDALYRYDFAGAILQKKEYDPRIDKVSAYGGEDRVSNDRAALYTFLKALYTVE